MSFCSSIAWVLSLLLLPVQQAWKWILRRRLIGLTVRNGLRLELGFWIWELRGVIGDRDVVAAIVVAGDEK